MGTYLLVCSDCSNSNHMTSTWVIGDIPYIFQTEVGGNQPPSPAVREPFVGAYLKLQAAVLRSTPPRDPQLCCIGESSWLTENHTDEIWGDLVVSKPLVTFVH